MKNCNKLYVQKQFSKANQSYDEVSYVHHMIADDLLDILLKNIPIKNNCIKNILEIGCGTGVLSEKISTCMQFDSIDINDLSFEMLNHTFNKIYSKNYNINILHGDVEDYIFNKKYNLIISSMSFQWLCNVEKLLSSRLFADSDFFAFSTLLNDTFCNLDGLYKKYGGYYNNQYQSFDEMRKMIENIFENQRKIVFLKKQYVLSFKDLYEFFKYLKKLGANSINNSSKIMNLKKMIDENKNEFHTFYDVFFCVICKNNIEAKI